MASTTDAGVTGRTRAWIPHKSLRSDRWWLAPLTTFVVFSAFVVYATIRAFAGTSYYSLPYLSPFYSPCLGDCVEGASDFGQPFAGFPLSAALIILIFPLGFRMTCYYYRKAYYRAFWLSPPACAVAEPHQAYGGETRLPLILNNLHRYFWYAAVVVTLILSFDTQVHSRYRTGCLEKCRSRPPTACRQEWQDRVYSQINTTLMIIRRVPRPMWIPSDSPSAGRKARNTS